MRGWTQEYTIYYMQVYSTRKSLLTKAYESNLCIP